MRRLRAAHPRCARHSTARRAKASQRLKPETLDAHSWAPRVGLANRSLTPPCSPRCRFPYGGRRCVAVRFVSRLGMAGCAAAKVTWPGTRPRRGAWDCETWDGGLTLGGWRCRVVRCHRVSLSVTRGFSGRESVSRRNEKPDEDDVKLVCG
ncbi:hypothetical protein BGZ61DRAFT_453013 [Ilyonectria robusta]|uniref:uncharacterized protein n=1 Tax=Ilyonectria robusta TaxID=1079257 RepID=UPI001E8CE820|nr:uncharacterized protein BGZ61DRAFT_453013 [Ilyonectria robusta]KAH8688282.1 hypothetical protein BGZ61DRAFT_453013 [Ilyonectria robusta]